MRDITKQELGYRRVVGFTFGSMTPTEKRQIIGSIKKWYAENKGLSVEDQMFSLFSSADPQDWINAGNFFLKNNDQRAVAPLMEKVGIADSFNRGELCELLASFGDASAKKVVQNVMESASEHSDRLSAAIALWELGDDSGVPLGVEYLRQPKYGNWDEPVWFLMRAKSTEGMEAIKDVLLEATPNRAGEVIAHICSSITGDLYGRRRKAAGCAEICPAIVAALTRDEYTGGSVNDVKIRVKDVAAKALVMLRDGTNGNSGWPIFNVDPKVFDELQSEEKRDAQIKDLLNWYEGQDKLSWDSSKNRLKTDK